MTTNTSVVSEIISERIPLVETRTLKSLNSKKAKYLKQMKWYKRKLSDIKGEYAEAEQNMKKAEEEITKLLSQQPDTIVTEHAILRYAERFYGLDTLTIIRQIKELPNANVVRRGNQIVTVIK